MQRLLPVHAQLKYDEAGSVRPVLPLLPIMQSCCGRQPAGCDARVTELGEKTARVVQVNAGVVRMEIDV